MKKLYEARCTDIESFDDKKFPDIILTAKTMRKLEKRIREIDLFDGHGGKMSIQIGRIR